MITTNTALLQARDPTTDCWVVKATKQIPKGACCPRATDWGLGAYTIIISSFLFFFACDVNSSLPSPASTLLEQDL